LATGVDRKEEGKNQRKKCKWKEKRMKIENKKEKELFS
jgi:hypothetical protein